MPIKENTYWGEVHYKDFKGRTSTLLHLEQSINKMGIKTSGVDSYDNYDGFVNVEGTKEDFRRLHSRYGRNVSIEDVIADDFDKTMQYVDERRARLAASKC